MYAAFKEDNIMEYITLKYALLDAKLAQGLTVENQYKARLEYLRNKKSTWITGAELELRRDIDQFLADQNEKQKRTASV